MKIELEVQTLGVKGSIKDLLADAVAVKATIGNKSMVVTTSTPVSVIRELLYTAPKMSLKDKLIKSLS